MINSALKGFGAEDISNKYFTCLYDQHKVEEAFGYTLAAFQETDPDKKAVMFPTPQSYIFNVTGIVSNEFTSAFYSCSKVFEETAVWYTTYTAGFADDQYYGYLISLFQAAAGNIVWLT